MMLHSTVCWIEIQFESLMTLFIIENLKVSLAVAADVLKLDWNFVVCNFFEFAWNCIRSLNDERLNFEFAWLNSNEIKKNCINSRWILMRMSLFKELFNVWTEVFMFKIQCKFQQLFSSSFLSFSLDRFKTYIFVWILAD